VATLIFEFGSFAKAIFPILDDFLTQLDPFLAALPSGFRYGIEIRNPEYLKPGYFTRLTSHGVAHELNAWTRMPDLGTQFSIDGIFTADFTVIRALLSKGRGYEQAVDTFEPYNIVKQANEPAREAMRRIAERAIQTRKSAFIFVNNRLDGNAPSTIEAVADRIVSIATLD
jgi:hypothetical protein